MCISCVSLILFGCSGGVDCLAPSSRSSLWPGFSSCTLSGWVGSPGCCLSISLSLSRARALSSFFLSLYLYLSAISHSISLSLSLVLFSYLNVCLSTLSTYLSIYKARRGSWDTSDVTFSVRENFLSVKEFTWGAKKTKADYVTRYVKHPTPLHKANFPPVCSGFA